ncbi:serine-type D-Ala-D-Ala carboxypeptidase [Thermoflexales bacterium]|nr:serine-type D-Ala-D-Ala carboxypeptidase [Thermoflexales bacterium]
MSKFDQSKIEAVLEAAVATITPAAQVTIRWRNQVLLSKAYGWLDPETHQRPTQLDSLFDLASVTKLFVVTAFMTLVEDGRVALDQPLQSVLTDFTGLRPIQPYEHPLSPGEFVEVSAATEQVDTRLITFRHLIVHNSGLPAWRPLKDQPTAAAGYAMALSTPFAYPIGTRVIYSDVGLILLGLALERLTRHPLDQIVAERVTGPLQLSHTRYLPLTQTEAADNLAPTEFCQWRQRRIVGEVHDENAWRLGGVAGHAGLFSTAGDVATFGQSYLNATLLPPATIAEMTRQQARDGDTRRGLGFALWSPDPDASSNPFSQHTYGHTGFTGTSLWIDPDRQLVVACLTNEVYHGRTERHIMQFRVNLHRAIVEEVDQGTNRP